VRTAGFGQNIAERNIMKKLTDSQDHKSISVKDRIFRLNTLMTVTAIAVCAIIGGCILKIYWEMEEKTLHQIIGDKLDGPVADELVKRLTVHNENFILLLLLFAILCILALLVVSRLYSYQLSRRIMQPLEQLEDGAERIQSNDFTVPVEYKGDREFEEVCNAFNGMQAHLLEEREKNTRYEKARQEMIAGISHDLRSPLTAIRGAVKGVLDGVATGQQQTRFLQAAYERSGEMAQLLDELFYFSKLETGGIPVQLRPIDLSIFLGHFFENREDSPEMEGIEVVSRLPEDTLPAVMADPEALLRILTNILTNSRKYAMASPLVCLVTLQRMPGGWQRLVLQDNGVGVPEDKCSRIFDEFYRVDESRGKKEGSGLGLYIVKYLCEAMGGRVSADTGMREEGFQGLAIVIDLKEGDLESDGEEGQNTDH